VIIGGEELAGEALAKARSLGAESVTFVFRELPDPNIASALSDAGARVVPAGSIVRLFGEGESLTGIEVEDTINGETSRLAAQTLIFSAGRFPELIFTGNAVEDDPRVKSWTAVPPYKQPAQAGESGLFAKGDTLSDFSGAIKAIGAGRRAAASIQLFIYEVPLEAPENSLKPDVIIQNVDHVEAVATRQRRIMPLADSRDLAQLKELEKGFDTATAQEEAARCLNCGLICYRNEYNQGPLEQIRETVNA
jgi:NADPH-dependent glutamate synthase beta subunit-like oxidoreductase